jgi:hypothetical protein
MTAEEIEQVFVENEFSHMKTTQADIEFRSRNGRFVYWQKRVRGTSSKKEYTYIRLALHPHVDPSAYLNIRGVSSSGDDFVHDSNPTQFPEKQHKGQREIHYGIPIDVDSVSALGEVLRLFNG